MSGVSVEDLLAVCKTVNAYMEAMDRHADQYPDDSVGSLTVARLNTRLACKSLAAAAAALDGYCAAYRPPRAQPPANPLPTRFPFAHLRGQ